MTENFNIMKNKINPKNLLSIPDYAKLMGVTIQTIYNWIRDGKVSKVKFLGKEFIDKSTYKA